MSYLACDKNDWISCESDIIIDCISFDQLKTWFKAKIANEISREEINKILLKLDVKSQVDDIEEGRIKRVKKSLNALLSDWEDIKNLRPLDGFKETIDEIIEKNIDKVLKEENNKVKERRKEIEGEKEIIEISFKDYIKRNETEKGKLEKIRKQAEACKEELQKKEEELKGIETHQIELIESIRIQAGMVMSYPLESVCCATEAVPVTSENESEYFEKVNALIEDDIMQRQLLIKLKKYSAFKTNDIRTGIFLASVLGNSIYQLCQPSPKWIEFKNFWEESLRCIWVSAHAKPDVWHFLLIENYNLALPECWGKPLWNILEEKTMLLPFAKEPSYPNNLSIIVSQASTESEDNTHIGLPTAVAEIWPDINISFDCEGWSKFSDDKLNGLAVNEEYYLPVENE
jgi:hypothetical protein